MLSVFSHSGQSLVPDGSNCRDIPPDSVWIDLLSPTAAEEQVVERCLRISVPTREDLVEIEPSSRLYQTDGVLHLTASVIAGVHSGDPRAVPISFVLTREKLVTVRYDDPQSFQAFIAHLKKQPDVCHSAASTLVFLLDAIVERAADILEEITAQTHAVRRRVFPRQLKKDRKRLTNDDLENIMIDIGNAEATLSSVRDSLASLTRLLSFLLFALPKYDQSEVPHLKTVARDVSSLSDMAAFLSGNINFLLDASMGLINVQQNAIIKIFSVAAVIFLPPTLVGTVYGMNFDYMPELKWLVGYPFALSLMLLSAILPYLWFRRKGWL